MLGKEIEFPLAYIAILPIEGQTYGNQNTAYELSFDYPVFICSS